MPDLFDEIAADVEAEMRKLGEEMVETVKQKLSTPVGIVIGPRGGKRKIRSKPGENPRKDSGALQADIRADYLDPNGDLIEVAVYSSKVYAPILQDQLERLVLSDTADEYEQIVPDRIAAVIRG